ncbi:Protein insensitive, partial [Dissostichus eleginoides]
MVTAMGEQLKRSLQAERTSKPSEEVTSESPQHSSDSDVTSIDLFEPIKKQPFIRKCSQNNIFVTSEEEEDEEEDTGILPQKEPACQQHPQKVWVELDKDTLEALKEMPRLVATMKAALDEISGSSSSGSCSSSGDSQQTGRNTGSNDLMFLGNSSVQVSTRLFQRLGNRRMSLFTQELATLIFGNETLAKSTLTGKGKSAETLDPEKVNAIIDTVRGKYPGTEVSTIRALLRRKCTQTACRPQLVTMGTQTKESCLRDEYVDNEDIVSLSSDRPESDASEFIQSSAGSSDGESDMDAGHDN